jgi:iron-sulfur cluster repair protein YtfE (RIC family)
MSYCFGGEPEVTETIQTLKEDIAVLQEKLQKLEEIEKQPRMNLQGEGKYAVVSYHDKVYYRLESEFTFSWYIKKGVSANYPVPTLVMVNDAETVRLLEGIYYNHIQVKKEKEQQIKEVVRESVKWCEENPEKSVEDYLTPKFI